MGYDGPVPVLLDDAAQLGVSNQAPPPPAGAPMGTLTAIPGKILFNNGPANYDFVKAGPMAMLKVADRDYRVWYEGNNNTLATTSETMAVLATSTDGVSFTKVGMVTDLRPNSGLWERAETSPAHLSFEDNLWWLYYHGGDPWSPPGSYTGFKDAIGLATSADLSSWTKYASNPIVSAGGSGAVDEFAVSSPRVFRLADGTYRMYYTAQAGATPGGALALCMATAPTRYGPWTKYGSNPIIASTTWGYHGGQIIFENNVWYGWYAKTGGGLEFFWSPDGITWFDGPNGIVYAQSGNANDPDSLVGDVVQGYQDGPRNYVSFGGFSSNLNGVSGRWEGTCMCFIDGKPTGGWQNGIEVAGAPTDGIVVASVNNFTAKSGGAFRQGSWWLTPLPPNVAISIKVTAAMSANNDGCTIHLGLRDPGTAIVSGYQVEGFLSAGVTTWQMKRADLGSFVNIGSTFTQTLAIGDTLMLLRKNDLLQTWYLASSGTWPVNGVLLGSVSDATYRRYGFGGVEVTNSQNFKFRAWSAVSLERQERPIALPVVYLLKNR